MKETPEPTINYVAILDILGFRNEIEENPMKDTYEHYNNFFIDTGHRAEIQLIAKLISRTKHHTQMELKSEKLKDITHIIIADSIYFWTKNTTLQSFKEICKAVGYSILSLSAHFQPFFLRGAISINENYFLLENRNIIGKGIVDSISYSERLKSMGAFLVPSNNFNKKYIEELQKEGYLFPYIVNLKKIGEKEVMMVDWFKPHKDHVHFESIITASKNNMIKARDQFIRRNQKTPCKEFEEIIDKYNNSLDLHRNLSQKYRDKLPNIVLDENE